MNAFLSLHQGGNLVLVNYFNALSFTAAGEKTIVLLSAGESLIVDESIDEIITAVETKAVWDKRK